LNWKFPRIFYGWWIVAACFVIALYVIGVVFYGFTAVFEPIAEEFGWSYALISFAASLRGVEAGLLAPFIGILIDRWGPRRMIFGGVLITALGLLLLSRVDSLGLFYAATIVMSVGISATGNTVAMTAVANWFRRKAGIAIGIVISGYGFGGILVPVIVQLVDVHGWRTAMVIMALGLLALGLPLSLVVRHKPEQYGYLPDGEERSTIAPEEGLAAIPAETADVSTRQALRSRVFWYIVVAFMGQFIAVVAVITHVMPYLSSIGITRSVSSLVATAVPLLSIGGRIWFGWLGDKFDQRRLAAYTFFAMMLGLLCFEFAPLVGNWLLVPFLLLFGFGYGGSLSMIGILPRKYFGRGSFGTIVGTIWGIELVISLAGAPLAGWVFDTWGSYQWVWLAFAAPFIVSIVAVNLMPQVGHMRRAE
jgi:sugar phosphate permease